VIGPGLPAESFEANETSLLLKLLAFNLTGIIRGELEDSSGSGWDLRRVQQTVLKAGARVAQHSQRLFVDVAKAAGVLWDECWIASGAGGGTRRGAATPAAAAAALALGRGSRRRPMPTCAWSCGNDRRTIRYGAIPKAN